MKYKWWTHILLDWGRRVRGSQRRWHGVKSRGTVLKTSPAMFAAHSPLTDTITLSERERELLPTLLLYSLAQIDQLYTLPPPKPPLTPPPARIISFTPLAQFSITFSVISVTHSRFNVYRQGLHSCGGGGGGGGSGAVEYPSTIVKKGVLRK